MNFPKVFKVFKKNYVLVPLEIFGDDPYKTLVSTIMSARTNDTTTLAASKRLFAKAPDLKSLGKLDQLEISNLIYPVGFYKTKAKHLKAMSGMIKKVPKTRGELMALPGVGRKTANLVLNRAFKIPAIAVDTHVHRITNLLGWVNTINPEKTEMELTKILPKKYWPDTNKLFVSIGRQYTSKKKLAEFLKNEGLV
ncbi:MAG TPA: endonuclease III [Patescibacteria group bacterium]|nr:endonuclease III [Patescibacteria group bacterium]